jgi:hypothetical protein
MTEVNSGMQGALQHLESADALIRKSLNWIKQQCIGGKGVSNEKLDAHQMASFDLAWCAAESTGARFAAEYAGKAAAADSAVVLSGRADGPGLLCRGLAEHSQSSAGRDRRAFGLNDTDDRCLVARPSLATFCQTQLDAGNLEALGRQVIALNGASGAYMLVTMRPDDAGFVPQAGYQRGDATGGGDSSSGPDHSAGNSRSADRNGLLSACRFPSATVASRATIMKTTWA